MVVIYDLVLVALVLLVVAGAIWFISNLVRYLVLRHTSSTAPGFFSLADRWLEDDKKRKEAVDAKKTETSGKAAKGGK